MKKAYNSIFPFGKCITATWVMHRQCILWCSELVCLKKKLKKKRETHLFGILVRILITLFGSVPVYAGRPFIGYHISHLQVHFVRTKFDIYVFINNTTTTKNKSGSQQTTHRHTS